MTLVDVSSGDRATAQQVRPRWVGVSLASVVVATSVIGMVLALGPGGRSLQGLMDDHVLTNSVDGVEIGLIAGVLAWLRPTNRVGWLLMSIAGMEALSILGEGWALATYRTSLPGLVVMAWISSWVWMPALTFSATLLPAIYPTGKASTTTARRIRTAAWMFAGSETVGVAALNAPFRSVVREHDLGSNPLTHGHWQTFFFVVTAVGAVGSFGLAIFSVVWLLRRMRYGRSPEREQLAWLVVAVVPSLVAGVAAPPWIAFAVNVVAFVAVPIGIVRHRLFDIKVVLRSGLVYGLLIASAAGAYLGIVALIGLLTPSTTGPPLFAASAVALLVVPGYRWLTTVIGRMVYGDRDDHVRALGRVGRRLAASDGTDLHAVAAAVAEAMRSPRVEIRDPAGRVLGAAGAAVELPMHEVALRHAGSQLGTLAVAWRTPVDPPARADCLLVDTLSAPVAVTVRAMGLANEVAQSRSQIVALRASERRSLRNDLHDGLGPGLSGVALGIEAALKAEDEQNVKNILGVVHDEVSNLVMEVRTIIEDLGREGHLPGGLVTALRTHADAASALTGLEIRVVVADLPALASCVEVALHRIAMEALTNAVRHADASQIAVTLVADHGAVRLTVADDGRGLQGTTEGVGRASMRERARTVGGDLRVSERPEGGTLVTAEIPWRAG